MSKYYVQLGLDTLALQIEHSPAGQSVTVTLPPKADTTHVVDLAAVHSNPHTGEGLYSLLINNRSYQLYLTPGRPLSLVELSRHRVELRVLTEREWKLDQIKPTEMVQSGRSLVTAPMPGLVKEVLVEPGSRVQVGSRLLVLEAMKMENDIVSPKDGKVTEVHASAAEIVEGGKLLVVIE